MSKSDLKLRALALRRVGTSVKDIARELGVSRGSVSVWIRDVVLTPLQNKKLNEQRINAGHKGRMLGAQMNKRKKQERIALAEREASNAIKKLPKNDLFLIGLGLYWGEGVKASQSSTAVINSDPRIIKLMIRWFIECWGLGKERFQPRVFISDTHVDREEIVLKFWSKELGIPRSQFRKTIFLKNRKKIYENRDVYYGVLALRVSKGTDLKYKILAYIQRISKVGILPG